MYEYTQFNPCDIIQNSKSRHGVKGQVGCKPIKLALSRPHTFWGLTSLPPNISTYTTSLHTPISLHSYLPTSLHTPISLYPYTPTSLLFLTSLHTPISLPPYLPTSLHPCIHTPISLVLTSLSPYIPTYTYLLTPPYLPTSLPPYIFYHFS